jgi:hypothetical protein
MWQGDASKPLSLLLFYAKNDKNKQNDNDF